jgi:signal transduction histidine kinase
MPPRPAHPKFDAVAEALPWVVLVLDTSSGEPVYANAAFKSLTGYSLSEIPTWEAWWSHAIMDAPYRETVANAFRRILEAMRQNTPAAEPLDGWLKSRSGELRCLQFQGRAAGDCQCVFAMDVTERRIAETELTRVLAHRTEAWREATGAALLASEEEARRIGRELHDTLCQDLVGLARQAEALALGLPEASRDPQALANRILNLASTASGAARQARELSYLLAVSEPVGTSLEDNLDSHLRKLESLYGLKTTLSLAEDLPLYSQTQQTHVIRLVREALVNAVRHAKAQRAWVDGVRQAGQTVFSVSSDGTCSTPPESWKPGLGLRQMRMRAGLLGAVLNLRSSIQGVVVEIILPI